MALALASPRSPRGGCGDFNAYRMALARAGKDIASVLVPASNSLHESALHNVRGDYKLNSMDGVNQSLQQDMIRNRSKYIGTPSVSSARFTVDLPTSPQHQKYCWGTKPAKPDHRPSWQSTFSRQQSSAISQGADDSEFLDETGSRSPSKEASYAGIRASLAGNSTIEGLAEEDGNPMSETDKAVARIVFKNRLKLDSLEKIFEELDQNQSGLVSRRAVAIRLSQKFLLGAEEGLEFQTPVFTFLKHACSAYEKTTAPLTKEKFIDYCRFAGLMIEYEMDSSPKPKQPTSGARAATLLTS